MSVTAGVIMGNMKKQRPVTSIIRPEGTYSILYGIHIKSQDPTDIPADTDAVILETGMHKYLDNPVHSLETLKKHVQYKELFRHLEERRIPVLFVDLKYRFPDPVLLMADTAFSGIEWMAGINMLKSKNQKAKINKGARYLVGAWLLLPFISNVLRLGSAFIGAGQKQTGELKKLSHRLHPEADFLYLTLRNAVIAEKEKYLMESFGKKPHFVTVLGAGHVGIEDTISWNENKRQQFFNHFVQLIKKVAAKEYVYQSIEYRYNGKKWEVHKIHENPGLKALLS
jgi:hypothetical protein